MKKENFFDILKKMQEEWYFKINQKGINLKQEHYGLYEKNNKYIIRNNMKDFKKFQKLIENRNEAIKIVEAMEKIEAGLDRNWLTIQKVLYIYNYLRENIMYDPKHEQKLSSEIRSLRGLITKNTVCAGYAMIFKELMDRNGIYCEYARGCTRKDANGE